MMRLILVAYQIIYISATIFKVMFKLQNPFPGVDKTAMTANPFESTQASSMGIVIVSILAAVIIILLVLYLVFKKKNNEYEKRGQKNR